MSEIALVDNITNGATDIRETRDDENETLNELDLKQRQIAEPKHEKRFVPEFRLPENAGIEHYLYIVVKDPSLRQYNRSRRLYYVPAAENLRDDMKAEEMRFVAVRVQKRNARLSLRKRLSRGGEIVLCRKLPDPVNQINLLHRELDTLEPNNSGNTAQNTRVTGVEGSRNLFHEMMINRNPVKIVKHYTSIDFNRDVYYDRQYVLRQKKMPDYFQAAAALAK